MGDNVCLRGKVSHIGEVSEVGAKKLEMVQATFSDLTGSITMDIWEDQISLIESGKVYLVQDLHVCIWGIQLGGTNRDRFQVHF